MRLPTYAQHRQFCEVDGWQLKAARPGKKTGHHHQYFKTLPDSTVLYTRVSHGSGEYRSRDFWVHIRRDQLRVTEEEFWAAVDGGIPPVREKAQVTASPQESLPLWLVKNLKELVGLTEKRILAMTPSEAREAWDEWCMSPKPGE